MLNFHKNWKVAYRKLEKSVWTYRNEFSILIPKIEKTHWNRLTHDKPSNSCYCGFCYCDHTVLHKSLTFSTGRKSSRPGTVYTFDFFHAMQVKSSVAFKNNSIFIKQFHHRSILKAHNLRASMGPFWKSYMVVSDWHNLGKICQIRNVET